MKLRITSIDLDGIPSSTEVPDFKLFEDRESIHEFRCRSGWRRSRSTCRRRSRAEHAARKSTSPPPRRSRSTASTGPTRSKTCTWCKSTANYVIELRGRTGEAKPSRPVRSASSTATSRKPVSVVLKTDPRPGRARPAGGHRRRDRDRAGRNQPHLEPRRRPAHLSRRPSTRRPARRSACRTSARRTKPARDELALLEVQRRLVRRRTGSSTSRSRDGLLGSASFRPATTTCA